MPWNLYQYVDATGVVKTVSNFTVPIEAYWCEMQSETNHIRYTLDGTTNPTTSSGMLLLTTKDPIRITAEQARKLRFIRDGAADAVLHLHWGAGRIVDDSDDGYLVYEDEDLIQTEDGADDIERE